MADEPDNLVLVMLRKMDEKLDRIGDDMRVNRRLDRLEQRVDRIERRLELSEASH